MIMRTGEPMKRLEAMVNRCSLKLPRKMALQAGQYSDINILVLPDLLNSLKPDLIS